MVVWLQYFCRLSEDIWYQRSQCISKNLELYGIRGIYYKWFKSDVSNRKQFVSTNDVNSNLTDIKCRVSQGSILGPLLFLIHGNDSHFTIKYCKVHHFTYDTNLVNFQIFVKAINKQINHDLKTGVISTKFLLI